MVDVGFSGKHYLLRLKISCTLRVARMMRPAALARLEDTHPICESDEPTSEKLEQVQTWQ